MEVKTKSELILNLVSLKFAVPINDFTASSQKRKYHTPRMTAMRLMSEKTILSLTKIGEQFHSKRSKSGFKDHATVLHAIKASKNLEDTDIQYRTEYKELSDACDELPNTNDLLNYKIKEIIVLLNEWDQFNDRYTNPESIEKFIIKKFNLTIDFQIQKTEGKID